MSPLVGVIGETGDVLALRGRGATASPKRNLASFVTACVAAIPKDALHNYTLWLRIDSAGFTKSVVDTCLRHKPTFTITAEQNVAVRKAIEALAMDEETLWSPAKDADGELTGSEVAETTYRFSTHDFRALVRRQAKAQGEQLSFDAVGGWRFFSFITNAEDEHRAVDLDLHHRRRGGASEEAIRQLKEDFGMDHAPVQNFFGNWLWWHAATLAYNVGRWLRVLALPTEFASCRGKRLRLAFLNVAAKVVRSGRRIVLRLPRAYRHAEAFVAALGKLRALPTFA